MPGVSTYSAVQICGTTSQKALQQLLQGILASQPTHGELPAFHALWIANASGAMIASSTGVLVTQTVPIDGDLLSQHQSHASKLTFVSPLSISKSTGVKEILLTVRLDEPDGKFAGVLGISLRADHFENLYPRLHLDPTTSITLVRDDGKLVFRYPFREDYLKIDLRSAPDFAGLVKAGSGSRESSISPFDRVERLIGFAKVGKSALLAVTAEVKEVALTQWKRNLWISAAIGMLGCITVCVLFVVVLEQLKRLQAATNASLRDALTGLHNRRFLDQQLPSEWKRAMRTEQALSVLFIDIDHFKQYNDHYGHQQGDICLREVAQQLQRALGRSGDTLSRYGGEEFVSVLPNTDALGAARVAERLMKTVGELAIPHAMSPTKPLVTVSVGVATSHPKNDEGWVHLLLRADEALFNAKSAGRNQVAHAAQDTLV